MKLNEARSPLRARARRRARRGRGRRRRSPATSIKIGVHQRPCRASTPTSTGRARCVAAADGGRGLRRRRQGHEGRGHLRRPPEQARRRLARSRASGSTPTRLDVHRRRAELRRGAGGEPRSPQEKKQGLPRLRRRPRSDLTGKACSPNTVHWTYDTVALANGTGNAIVKTGGDSWFFLTADYAFGHALERDTEAVVLKNGGKVLGKVRHPLNDAATSRRSCCRRRRRKAQDPRPRQRRRRHHQLDQAGGRVRHRQGRPEARRPAGVHHRRARARA